MEAGNFRIFQEVLMTLSKYLNFLFILILLIVFAILATFDIGKDFPPGLNHDAAWTGLYAIRILNGEAFTVFIPEAYGQEALFHYIMAAFFYLFGISKESIELTATFFALISIPFIYYLIFHNIKDKLFSFLLSLMFITSSAFVLYSRVGWRLITLIPLVFLVMFLSNLYVSVGKARTAFWLGSSCALILYTYSAGRSIVLYFIFFWLVILIQDRKKIRDFILSLGTFIFISLPMLVYGLLNIDVYFGRAQALYNGLTLNSFFSNFKTALLYFNLNASGNDFFTNFPVLEGPMGVLWIIGFIIALIKIKKYWIYLFLFIIFLLPSVLTTPSFHRAIGTLPVVYMFGFITIFEANKVNSIKKNKKIFLLLIIVIVSLQLYSSISKLYLNKQPFLWGFYPEATKVGKYLKTIDRANAVIYAENWPIDTLTFMSLNNDKSVIPKFKNYQSYNTISKDGIVEIVEDLSSGIISKNSIFVVDIIKEEDFIRSLQNSSYKPKKIKTILYKNKNIASVYKL